MQITWQQLCNHAFQPMPKNIESVQIRLAQVLMLLLIPIDIGFAWYDWSMTLSFMATAKILNVAALVFATTWVRSNYPAALPLLACILSSALLVLLFLHPLHEGFMLIWMVLLPFGYFSLLGLQRGMIWTVIFLVGILLLAYIYAAALPYQPYQIAVFSIVYTLQSCFAALVILCYQTLATYQHQHQQAQEKAIYSSQLWQKIINYMQDPMLIVNGRGEVIHANAEASLMNLNLDKFIDSSACYGLSPVCHDSCQNCAIFTAYHQQQSSEKVIFDKDHKRWILVSTFPLHGKVDGDAAALFLFKDVTQKHAQEEARSQRLFHFQSMQHINLVIAESRGTQKTLLNLLAAIRAIFKADRACLLTPDEDKTNHWQVPMASTAEKFSHINITGLDVSSAANQMLQEAFSASQPIVLPAVDYPEFRQHYLILTQLVFTIPSKVGKPWLIALHRCSSEEAWDDNQCHVLAAIADRITDVLDAWQLNETLERRTDQYKQLVENMPDGVIILQDQHIIFANEVMQDMLGGSLDEGCLGKRLEAYIHPDDVQSSLGRFDSALHGKRNPIHEIKLIDDEGQQLDVISSSMAISYQGKPAVQIIMRDVTKRNLLDKALHDSLDNNKKLARQLINVQEQERVIIAQDLHDDSGQVLTAMSINLQSIKNNIHDEKLMVRVEETEAMVGRLFKSIRSSLETLNPTHIDVLGLGDAMRSELDAWSFRYNIAVSVDISSAVDFPSSEIATAIFRVVQEALTNIAKHAKATHVWLSLALTDEHPAHIALVIRDDGNGFDTKAISGKGFGLLGMQSRTDLVSGEFTLQSKLGQGTTIHADFPLTPKG